MNAEPATESFSFPIIETGIFYKYRVPKVLSRILVIALILLFIASKLFPDSSREAIPFFDEMNEGVLVIVAGLGILQEVLFRRIVSFQLRRRG